MDQFSWKPCNLVIANYHEECGKHPLYLGISSEHAQVLDHAGEDSFVACLQTTSAGGPSGPRQTFRHQFVAVEVLSVASLHRIFGQLQPSTSVILYASEIFVRHHDLNTTFNHGFGLRRVCQPPELSHVTLSACTEDSFAWLSSREWYDRLLLDACGGQPVLCRQGDVCTYATVAGNRHDPASYLTSLRHLFDSRVVECRPTRQGVVGPRTAFTVVRSDALHPGSACVETEIGPAPMEDSWCFTRIASLPRLLALVAILLLPRHRQRQSVSLRMLVLAFRLAGSWRESLAVRVLPKSPLACRTELARRLDPFQLVMVTTAFLERHSLPDLCWVTAELVSAVPDGDGSRRRRRWVRLCAVDRHQEQVDFRSFGQVLDGVAHVTPQLWFNLNDRPSKLVQPDAKLVVRKFSVDPGKCKPGATAEQRGLMSSPAFALQVHVSLVNTVETSGTTPDCYAMLSNYFDVPRLVCERDVLSVCSSEDGSTVYHFLVTSMIGASESIDVGFGLLVDKVHSTLYQEGAAPSYVPLSMNVYHSSARLHPIWNSPLPSGFAKQCDELTRLILPYLKSTKLRLSASPTLCLTGARGCGKMLLVHALSKLLNLQVYTVNCHEVMGESSGANDSRIKVACQKAASFAPCLFVLRNVHVIGHDSDGVSGESRSVSSLHTSLAEIVRSCSDLPVFVIGITTEKSLLSTELTSIFLHYFNIEPPNNGLRSGVLSSLLEDVGCSLQLSLDRLVKKTSGFLLGDLAALVSLAVAAAFRRVQGTRCSSLSPLSLVSDEVDMCLAGVQIFDADFDDALAKLQSAQSDAIGAPKIPDITWKDVGGLEYVKSEILDTVQLPLEHPELLASGLRRSGVLLYGPPGTGKTLLAKAVASECSLNFLSVKGPELINMYVGQSEENVRKGMMTFLLSISFCIVFHRARTAAPCIIFFDELDSLAPNRGRSGDSGGVMDRVVSQLLAELDGLHRSTDVFVMGATNRPDLIDPALLRPGRFDKLLCVGVCRDSRSQLKILEALTRKFLLAEGFHLSEFVERCPKNLSGADFYALCSDALLIAMSRRIQRLESGIDSSADKDADLIVAQDDFEEALTNLTPSLSSQELNHYDDVRNKITN